MVWVIFLILTAPRQNEVMFVLQWDAKVKVAFLQTLESVSAAELIKTSATYSVRRDRDSSRLHHVIV